MTPLRSLRGKWTHWSADLRSVLCPVRLKAPIIEPDRKPDCPKCLAIKAEIESGN